MINIQHLTKIIGEKILFEDVSLKIRDRQKVGLIGPNGAGKTTLLNIIAGTEETIERTVVTEAERLGFLHQKLIYRTSEEVGEYLKQFLANDWETYKIDQVLAKVGLKGLSTRIPIANLSGGQKMKVGLAGVLMSEPTTLLLDEPTNNLDVSSLSWLEKFVQNFNGKIIVVSHDRYFLDACVNKIIEIDPFTHKLVEYGGNYSDYKNEKVLRQKNQLSDFDRQEKKENHMREWILEKQEQLKYHPSTKVARQLQAMKTRFDREITDSKITKPKTYEAFEINSVGGEVHKEKSVLTIKNLVIYDLLDVEELYLYGRERIHLLGQNGVGKTTFLKVLLGLLPSFSGDIELGEKIKIGYFSQEHEVFAKEKTVLQTFIAQTNQPNEAAARALLGKYLFTKQKVFSQIQFLSEGEKARLLLAILIHQQNDFLFLDEPTNHLDLESREVLAEALRSYVGGFMVVSHDRYFIEQIGIDRELEIRNGKIIE